MNAFLTSTALVTVAEIGDKTQLLSFVLAARLRKQLAIMAGILAATTLNHLLAGAVGATLAHALPQPVLLWAVGLSFVGFGFWALKPDRLDDSPQLHRAGAFLTSFVAFFVAEMGDKTQFATVALAARFDALATVVVGTTLGMMIANVPAVWIGDRLAQRIPMAAVRIGAAALFIFVGAVTLWSAWRPVV
jgi:Ca2+/H+ antiporter, TMEM165/GDT1 family